MWSPPDARAFVPASAILQELHNDPPVDHFTLNWLMERLHKHSFGLVMLLLAIVAIVPGVCMLAGLLLMIPAVEMIAGRRSPVFPRWIAARPVPTRHLGAVVQRAIPVLRFLETMIYPRWPMPLDATKRVVGIAVLLLSVTLMLIPIPLSNVIPALVIALISLAYLEQDGLVLAIGLLAGLVVVAVGLEVVWEILLGAKWLLRVW